MPSSNSSLITTRSPDPSPLKSFTDTPTLSLSVEVVVRTGQVKAPGPESSQSPPAIRHRVTSIFSVMSRPTPESRTAARMAATMRITPMYSVLVCPR